MFHDGDLQSGIALALQQSKAVLCFVHDDTEPSRQWEDILRDPSISSGITAQTVALRLEAGSQEAGFLSPICAMNNTPAIVVIKNAQLQANLQSGEVSVHDLKDRLGALFGTNLQDVGAHTSSEPELAEVQQTREQAAAEYLDLQPTPPGQMRLPNNAYDALRNHTQKLVDAGTAPSEVFQAQLNLLDNISIFHDEVQRLRAQGRPEVTEYLQSRLLRLPAVGLRIPSQSQTGSVAQPITSTSSSSSSPPSTSSQQTLPRPAARTSTASPAPQRGTAPSVPGEPETEKPKAQRAEYIKMQREREHKQREERERIKAQIKADREERRRLDEMRKRGGSSISNNNNNPEHATSKARSSEIRVQVRTFDGSTLRSTFQPTSTLSADVRPWIDNSTSDTTTNVPYDLKLILTPLPNRNIEAGEEELSLSDLGIVGSCTLVMVPVKGYVESYTGSTPGGLLGAAVSGGYSLVSGTAGMVLGGVKSLLGYNTASPSPSSSRSGDALSPHHTGSGGQGSASTPSAASEVRTARVRTLADQRAESAGRDQQFYNGNQLNFEPKKDDDAAQKRD